MRKNSGFSLLEMMIVVAIISILASIAVPNMGIWIANNNLKRAARELVEDMQWLKLNAIKNSSDKAIVFDIANNSYTIYSDPGGDNKWDKIDTDGSQISIKAVNFSDYGSGVQYGFGDADIDATTDKKAVTEDTKKVSYSGTPPNVVFTFKGMVNKAGYVYLENNKKTSYAIGTLSLAGAVTLKKWMGSSWEK